MIFGSIIMAYESLQILFEEERDMKC